MKTIKDVETVWERSKRLMRMGDWFDDCVVWKPFRYSMNSGEHLRDKLPMYIRQLAKDKRNWMVMKDFRQYP